MRWGQGLRVQDGNAAEVALSIEPAEVRQPTAPPPAKLHDIRFRTLVGTNAWSKLPSPVQLRFSKRLTGTAVALYVGTVVETRLNRWGWLLAQCLRPIGAPLPLSDAHNCAAMVCVSEDSATGGQCWSRLYARTNGFPQVISSSKAFAGPTGLEENIGAGIGMALRVIAQPDGLIFASDHYFWRVAGRRWRLPAWLSPGKTIVTHRDLGDGKFAFDLSVSHPWFGELLHQHALFYDVG